jgi:DNA-binding NarL/FixJ family response regulator
MAKMRVLLVDDNAAVRSAVRPLFTSHNFEVVGEAENGLEAVEKAPDLKPDLIVLDLSMPEMNGFEAAPLLLKVLPKVRLILFTIHDAPELKRISQAAGIHAVVAKGQAVSDLTKEAEALFAKASKKATC